jgi:hypothetical protein
MAVSRAIRRLLRVRTLEEEQGRLALEAALGELSRLERALLASHEADRLGRRLVASSASSGELADRQAGLVESHTAARRAEGLTPRIANGEAEVSLLREEFLARRVERRQAETLIDEMLEREAAEAARRGQQSLDDWHGARRYRQAPERRAGAQGDEEDST